MPKVGPETPDDNGQAAPGATPNFFKSLLRTLEIADTAAADALVITVSVATLLPVIQAMMSFTETSAQNSRNAVNLNAQLDTVSIAVLTDACDKILGIKPTSNVVYESKKVTDTVSSQAVPPVVT